MNRELVRDSLREHLGVDLWTVYAKSTVMVDTKYPVPEFATLYEEYRVMFLEQRTNLKKNEIDRELVKLKRDFGDDVFDIEQGFVGEYFGITHEAQFFQILLDNQLFFQVGQKFFNQPIVEVW